MFIVGNMKHPGTQGCRTTVDRGTVLGNPFRMKDETYRLDVIDKYRRWLWNAIQAGNRTVIAELECLLDLERKHGTVILNCWCAPKPCHADIIVRALNWMKQRAAS